MDYSSSPPVSICLLTYKRGGVLRRSLDSLLAQTYREFELVINDDCSPDDTAQICAEYAARDSRVKYCRNETNLRYAGNQNAALARARYDLIGIVHDGDVYRSDCVEKWVGALRENPSVGLVFNASNAMDEAGNVVKKYRHPYPAIMPGHKMINEMFRLYNSPIFGITMFRKNLALKAGGFDTAYPVLADVDMWFRILMSSDVAYINEPLYQIHPRESDHVNTGINWRILSEQYSIFIRNADRQFTEKDKKRPLARRHLRKMYRRQIIHSCLWAIKRGQWHMLPQGVKRFCTCD